MEITPQSSDATPLASEAPTLSIEGILFDSSAEHIISCADIEFVCGDARVLATTSEKGHFSNVLLTLAGDWTVGPDTKSYSSHYCFEPVVLKVDEAGHIGQIDVVGDNLSNAKNLQEYVKHVFLAGQNLFEEEIGRYDQNTLSEAQVKSAAAIVARLVNTGLEFVIAGASHPSKGGIMKDEIAGVLAPLRELIASDLDVVTLRDPGADVMDSIPCSLCYTRYANNPTRLQTCLCCAPCT